MKTPILIALNVGIAVLFFFLWRKKNLLSSFDNGKWYLSWLAVAVITLMDELTSLFYAPSEAHRFIGSNAILFIAATSLVIRLLTTRMTEIARILEKHGIKGGGVYSFSYMVLGPLVSFVAVASIFVAYILTACISTVSAVANANSIFGGGGGVGIDFGIQMAIVWGVCFLNIAGIRESARFTFGVFSVAAFVLLTLMASGAIEMPAAGWHMMGSSVTSVGKRFATDELHVILGNLKFIVIGVASCILAYSGVESVVQTAGLTRSWHDIRKAYIFLGVTVGILTPVVSALVLSRPDIDFAAHEGDLITHFARLLNGQWFAVAVGSLASVTLTMAVNTAYIASAELIERVAHRYGFAWLLNHNRRGSLYRIHLMNGAVYTSVILITQGSQKMLAEMYALGLVASFVINMGSLLIYRYRKGALVGSDPKETYHRSRFGTVFLFLLLFGCFIYLAIDKPYGLVLWASFTVVCLVIGIRVARRREPEIEERKRSDTPMEMILSLAETDANEYHIHFRRPQEELTLEQGAVYVSFYSPRQGAPDKRGPNHFRLNLEGTPLVAAIREIIELVRYEFPQQKVVFHFGWPLSSWLDRISIGVMVMSLLKLPREYPEYEFRMEYFRRAKREEDAPDEESATKDAR